MSYPLQPEPGEVVVLDVWFQPSPKSAPLHFAVSDRALYLPAQTRAGGPAVFRRVPKSSVTEVRLREVPPYGAWALAALMLVAGAALGASCLASGAAGSARACGGALALIAGGCLLALAGRGRQRLVVAHADRVFQWTAPLAANRLSQQKAWDILSSILGACEAGGMPVSRPASKPAVPA